MQLITVKKADLLAKLKENRTNHRKIYEEALEGYKNTAIKAFTDNLENAKQGRPFNTYINLQKPVDQTKDYDRAIAMMEMHIEDEVELDEHDFAQYVMDDWGWKQTFLTTNSAYSASATRALNKV